MNLKSTTTAITNSHHPLNRVLWSTGILLFIYHFFSIGHHFVEVPFSSEWIDLNEKRFLERQFDWRWIFSTQNNHPRALHALLKWVNLNLTDDRLKCLTQVNFVTVAVGTCLLFFLLEKRFHLAMGWALLFVASDKANENYFWSNQGMFFHFVFGVYLSFFIASRERWRSLFSLPFVLLAFFSSGGGAVFTMVFCSWNGVRALLAWKKGDKENTFYALALAVFLVSVAVSWMKFASFDNEIENLVYPIYWDFWRYYLNMFSNGFGYELRSIVPAILLLGGFAKLSHRQLVKRGLWKEKDWQLFYAISITLLLTTVLVAVGRASFGPGHAKTSRYTTYTIFLVPFFWILWVRANQATGFWLKKWVAPISFAVLLLPLWNNFQFDKVYSESAAGRLRIREEVVHFLKGEPVNHVPGGPSPEGFPRFMDRASHLRLHFLNEIKPGL